MIPNAIKAQYHRLILHKDAQRYAEAFKQGNEVKYPHQKNYLSETELEKAIKGNLTLGIMLIQDKTGLTKAGCIDIDCPRDAEDLTQGLALAKRLQETAQKCDLKAYIEFSGNRGYHIWIFVKKAITASLMQSVLKAIAKKAEFECKEYFPNALPESKCIKLPCTIHLKSGKRCGFIEDTFNPHNPQINLESQADLMAGFIQNEVSTITAVANLGFNSSVNNLTAQSNSNGNQSEVNKKLNSFGSNHPSCINHLLHNGSPLEIDYNQANLTLIRYCLSREFNLPESLTLAELMAKNTSENHPTSKDYQGKIANFKSGYKSALRNQNNYQFNCSYILANLNGQKLATRGCIGSKCSLFASKSHFSDNISAPPHGNSYNHSNHHSDPQNLPLNRFIFQAMINLSNEGKEGCKSLIMQEVENLINQGNSSAYNSHKLSNNNSHKLFDTITQTDNLQDNLSNNNPNKLAHSTKLIESEILAYLIQSPDTISDCLDILPQGFKSITNQPLSEYLDYLLNLELPSEDTLETHLNFIREQGIKEIATSKFKQYQEEIKEAESVEVLNKSLEETESLLKQSLNDKQILTVDNYLHDLVDSLLSEERASVATPSPHLNNVLNGGFMGGKLYVLGAPPASGKSTICAWCGDYASMKGFKIVYASYEMNREQLFIASLARLGELNSAVIEGKRFLDSEYPAVDILKSRLKNAINKYQEEIAPNLIIIEADESYTPNRLKAIAKKVEADLLIVDYLQLLSSGDLKLDNAYQETLRVSKIATELKRLARSLQIPVIAISDINKESYLKAISGNDLDMGALRDSFKIAHSADVILLLQSGQITTGRGDEKTNKDQLTLLAEKYPDKANEINHIKYNYPLNTKTADTYSRISIVKNRGGKLGEPIFKYSRALHDFQPLDFEIKNNQIDS